MDSGMLLPIPPANEFATWGVGGGGGGEKQTIHETNVACSFASFL
jgi:hypothetical protein